jgi:hypothetical protein
VSLRPEEIEEEGAAKDRGDVDANEDIVGCNADKVVIVDGCSRVLMGDEILLADIVCEVLVLTLVTKARTTKRYRSRALQSLYFVG